jgi:simple sugar transport system permease protein
MMEFLTEVVFTSNFAGMLLRIATPIIFGAYGALIFDRAGINNIGIEGVMLFSALGGVLVSAWTQSTFWGVLGAVTVGVLLSLLFGYCVLKLKAPGNLSSMALNMLGDGGTVFLLYVFAGEKGASVSLPSKSVPVIELPVIKDIPVLGPILSGNNILTYIALISAVAVSIMMFHTPLGLRMRAVGESPDAASSVGIKVHNVKYLALALSGVLIGLGGAFMSMGDRKSVV